MEYFWYVLAAAGAGIGTGFAGISAATVMVPILIVLCPSFGGEYGAYQATAIALASDILGAAVTSATYARRGRIDLRHGWIMLACVVVMCAVGSYVAYLAGNTVLGGFTLLLTFASGIRFLVKPESSGGIPGGGEGKLGAAQIIISLIFGIGIGFGTGFVGTGGGMTMFLVFTLFLRYETRTAVGTSTFIMTFTAITAFACHASINPSVVLERWDVIIICVSVGTLFSLVSARFANRLPERAVGLTTGAVLTVLGAVMIYLNYFRDIRIPAPLADMFRTLLYLSAFILVLAALAIVCIRIFRIEGEYRRKILHTVAFLTAPVMLFSAENWYSITVVCFAVAIALYPVMGFLERLSFYPSLFFQRRPGEVRMGLIMMFLIYGVMTAVFWGIFGEKYAAVSAMLVWGAGDAAAALGGITFGRHKHKMKIADSSKSWEGSLCMLAVDLLVTFFCMMYAGKSVAVCAAAAVVAASASAFVELISKNGKDNLTVPLTGSVLIFLFML